MKHAPEPWKAENRYTVIKAENLYIIVETTISGECGDHPNNADKANANPDLLQALISIQECCDGYIGTGPLKTINEIAQAAIDKAEAKRGGE